MTRAAHSFTSKVLTHAAVLLCCASAAAQATQAAGRGYAHEQPIEGSAAQGSAPVQLTEPLLPREAPEQVQTEYREVVTRAVSEFAVGRWAEARSLFLRAHQLWPSARTFRSLGMTSFELRTYARALRELQAAIDDARRPLSDTQRLQVATLLAHARKFVSRYRVQLSPDQAVLFVDGTAHALGPDGLLVLDAGSHELLVRAEGYRELRRQLHVQGSEAEEITLALAPLATASLPALPPHALPGRAPTTTRTRPVKRIWTWVGSGAAVALGAASAALWLSSKTEFDELAEACQVQVCVRGETDTSSIERLERAHKATFALAIGAAVVATALFFLEGDRRARPGRKASVRVGLLDAHARF